MNGSKRGALIVAAIWSLVVTEAVAQTEPDAAEGWQALERLRAALELNPLSASFVQTYEPTGFSQGEKETGKLFMSLPACLRWDYELPFPKIFLLCENTAYSWNQDESTGRRINIVSDAEPGLDLMRLNLNLLRQRYNVEAQRSGDEQLQVILTPQLSTYDLVEARLTLESDGKRLGALSYRDVEGNVTTFSLSDYQVLDNPNLFTPPPELDWMDED